MGKLVLSRVFISVSCYLGFVKPTVIERHVSAVHADAVPSPASHVSESHGSALYAWVTTPLTI